MEYAIAGLVIFISGVSVGLWCKRNVVNSEQCEESFNNGLEYGIGLGRAFADKERRQ